MKKVHAVRIPSNDPGGYNIEGPLENAAAQGKGFFAGIDNITIGVIVSQMLPIIFAVAGILLFLYFLVAGVQLITSGGEPKMVEQAKTRLTNAVIGAFVIAFAYVVVKLVQGTLQIG